MPTNIVSRFMRGFLGPIKGGQMILGSARLLKLSIMPAIITAITIMVGLFWGYPALTGVAAMLLPAATGILGTVLYWGGLIAMYLIFTILLILGIVITANLVSVPFNSILAEKALFQLNYIQEKPFSITKWISVTLRMLRVSVVRTAVFLTIGVLLFLLALIPGIQVIAGFLGLVILAADCWDYSMEIMELGFRTRIQSLKKYFWELAGFGCCFGLSFLIPLLNFFVLPAAVVGGAVMLKELSIKES